MITAAHSGRRRGGGHPAMQEIEILCCVVLVLGVVAMAIALVATRAPTQPYDAGKRNV